MNNEDKIMTGCLSFAIILAIFYILFTIWVIVIIEKEQHSNNGYYVVCENCGATNNIISINQQNCKE